VGSDWAITQSGDEWYMRSSQHPVVGNGRLVVDEAELEIDRINLVYGLFNPNDRALLTIGAHSFVREDGTQGHFLQVTTSSPIEHGLTTRQNVRRQAGSARSVDAVCRQCDAHAVRGGAPKTVGRSPPTGSSEIVPEPALRLDAN
jgi:hypothetical protein